jgi:hypothetical protein
MLERKQTHKRPNPTHMNTPKNLPIVVFTTKFVMAHGKQPSGRGTWCFSIFGADFWYTGTYSEARTAAKAHAKIHAGSRRSICIDLMS